MRGLTSLLIHAGFSSRVLVSAPGRSGARIDKRSQQVVAAVVRPREICMPSPFRIDLPGRWVRHITQRTDEHILRMELGLVGSSFNGTKHGIFADG